MTCETIYLRNGESDVRLCSLISTYGGNMKVPPRDAVVVLPGGGYHMLSEQEAEPIAKAFLAAGFNAFVLYYSIGDKASYPRPLQDASMAVCHIRENAQKYNVAPDRIFLCGFSAGSHVAGCLGAMWHTEWAKASPDMPYGLNKPNGLILSYPFVSLTDNTYVWIKENIKVPEMTMEDFEKHFSVEMNVSDKMPPVFIWQTQDDSVLSVKHSLLLANETIRRNIPTELHIFPTGLHGIALATEETFEGVPERINPHVANWLKLAVEWTKNVK